MHWVPFLLSAISLFAFAGCRLPEKAVTLPFFPIGICGVPSTNDFQALKLAGFNVILGAAEQTYLDAAYAAGLKVWATPGSPAGPSFNPTVAIQRIKAFDNHPALWAWFLIDEPEMFLVSPAEVRQAHRTLKECGAHKPTSLVLYKSNEALHYAGITDLLLTDRYPVPWLPLANFGQHVTLARLALGEGRPLIPIIQAFDWSYYPKDLRGEKNLRPPSYEEIRCMTYEALARGANGVFYFAYDHVWKMREHPETWESLKSVVREVNERLPLFEAKPQWWPKKHRFGDRQRRFNAALESSITSALLHVTDGNALVPAGDYILAANNTGYQQEYGFTLPERGKAEILKSESRNAESAEQTIVPVLGESRGLRPVRNWIDDEFAPYAVHVYGPLR